MVLGEEILIELQDTLLDLEDILRLNKTLVKKRYIPLIQRS